ncbi:alkaline phosphatase family protein [Halorubrum ezzemoulense]|uniref:hypothetical protein n=1 Tax=Halorubrum ezzemoulense TaxID=337243 RepID=UPI001C3E16ED|nr:hypothetical protein [Halorubrum ezzemoulense]
MSGSTYTIDNLRRVASIKGVSGIISRLGTRINQEYYKMCDTDKGVQIINEDWDNLIILDGCRYDTFSEVCELSGELEYRMSKGSESREFIEQNFIGEELTDTVYITANPFATTVPDRTFHYIDNILEEEWDSGINTVPPSAVVDHAESAAERFPNKRLIVHFMQPHYPFIGNFGKNMESGGINPRSNETSNQIQVWKRLQYGLGVPKGDVVHAYRENLNLVLNAVSGLLDNIEGKSVITSDHGNLIGDRLSPVPVRGYGHPRSVYVEDLVKVPWFTIDGNRRMIKPETPISSDELKLEEVNQQLDHLGYK